MARTRLILDRYHPLAEAGAGGFGTVQVAWDTRIQRKVAIKCIELEDADARLSGGGRRRDAGADGGGFDPDAFDARETVPLGGIDDASARTLGGRDDFTAAMHAYLRIPGLDEARTAALLNDSCIVAVYDFEVQESTAYLIMEYVEGMTLTELLAKCGDRLTLDIVAAVFSSVAHALEVAHENQVLHLDIKPDNILIDKNGQVKVTDFGLAKLAGIGGFATAGGGTIGYMPLEQMRGEPLDVRCDEWALASVSYEMLTGENPFLAETLAQAEAAIEDAELVLPSLCWDDLDEQLDDVLFYALDPDREERYESMADFAEEMEKFLGDPKRGKRQLAALVNDAQPEEGAEDDGCDAPAPRERIPLDERVGELPRKVAAHAVGAAGSAAIAALGLVNLPGASGADNPLFWVLLALACVLGAAIPHIGVLFSHLVLSAALIAQGAAAAGCALIAAAGAWWWFSGRRGDAQANTACAVPLAGAVGAGAVAPLAAGAALRPLQALGAAAFSLLQAFALASLGSGSLFGWGAPRIWDFAGSDIQRAMAGMLVDPAFWVVAAGWIASAAICALLSLRRSRAASLAGAVAAAAILIAAVCAASGISSNGVSWTPSPEAFASIVFSAVAVAVLRWIFPEKEEPLHQE